MISDQSKEDKDNNNQEEYELGGFPPRLGVLGEKPEHIQGSSEEVNLKTIKIGLKEYNVSTRDYDEDQNGNERFAIQHEHLELSAIPMKIYVLCGILDVLGLVYLILTFVFLGLGQYSTALMFGIFTVLIWTPGIYFSIKLFQARKAKTP